MQGVVSFFGRIAMLIDQNTQAFHLFMTALLQVSFLFLKPNLSLSLLLLEIVDQLFNTCSFSTDLECYTASLRDLYSGYWASGQSLRNRSNWDRANCLPLLAIISWRSLKLVAHGIMFGLTIKKGFLRQQTPNSLRAPMRLEAEW